MMNEVYMDGRRVSITLSNSNDDGLVTGTGTQSARLSIQNVCKKRLWWTVEEFLDGVDITPELISFEGIPYNTYDVAEDLIKITDAKKTSLTDLLTSREALRSLAEKLFGSLRQSQLDLLSDVSGVAMHPSARFQIEMLKSSPGALVVITESDHAAETVVRMEVPLFGDTEGYDADSPARYLVGVTENASPVKIYRAYYLRKFDGAVLNTETEVMVPKTLSCTRQIDFQSQTCTLDEQPDMEENGLTVDLIDALRGIERDILERLAQRKAFIEALATIAALVEFDAADFSCVVIAVRMKHEAMCTICSIHFRLPWTFPQAAPEVTVNDLQNGYATKVDTSALDLETIQSAETFAFELHRLCCRFICRQAFAF
jgi:hypothetical protein